MPTNSESVYYDKLDSIYELIQKKVILSMSTKLMVLRSKLLFGAILTIVSLFIISCSLVTKEIQESYVFNLKVDEVKNTSPTEIYITGEYGESAWGIDSLNVMETDNKLEIRGRLRQGELGIIKLKVKIPDNVNGVYFYSKKIWSRTGD